MTTPVLGRKPRKETLSYVLPESLFTSVSIGRQGPPLSVSLMGTKKLKLCTVRTKYFVLGRLEQPRQNKNLLYQYDQPNEPPTDLFHLYSLSSHSPQFQQSAGATSMVPAAGSPSIGEGRGQTDVCALCMVERRVRKRENLGGDLSFFENFCTQGTPFWLLR